jgi:hypothetical protein
VLFRSPAEVQNNSEAVRKKTRPSMHLRKDELPV